MENTELWNDQDNYLQNIFLFHFKWEKNLFHWSEFWQTSHIKGSMEHLQNIMEVLKRNKVILTWNDSLWWNCFIAVMQHLIENFTIFFWKRLKMFLATQEIKENLGYSSVSYFWTERLWVLRRSKYSSNVKSNQHKKFHGDLDHLQMCHTTFKKRLWLTHFIKLMQKVMLTYCM